MGEQGNDKRSERKCIVFWLVLVGRFIAGETYGVRSQDAQEREVCKRRERRVLTAAAIGEGRGGVLDEVLFDVFWCVSCLGCVLLLRFGC